MSLRTGVGFLDSLRDGREIWLEGERVKDVTAHPRLRGAAMTIADLYTLQHQPRLQDRLSFALDDGEHIGYSHINREHTTTYYERFFAGDPWRLGSLAAMRYAPKGELQERIWEFLRRTREWDARLGGTGRSEAR